MIALPSNLQWSGHLYINHCHQWRTKTMWSICPVPLCVDLQPQTDDTDASYVVSIVSKNEGHSELHHLDAGLCACRCPWTKSLMRWCVSRFETLEMTFLDFPTICAPWKRTWQIRGSLSPTKIIFQSPMFRCLSKFQGGYWRDPNLEIDFFGQVASKMMTLPSFQVTWGGFCATLRLTTMSKWRCAEGSWEKTNNWNTQSHSAMKTHLQLPLSYPTHPTLRLFPCHCQRRTTGRTQSQL